MQYYDEKSKHILINYVSIFLIMVIGLAVGGYQSYLNFKHEFQQQATHQISAIAKLKINNLESWRMERMGNAEFLSQNNILTSLTEKFLQDPQDTETKDRLFSRLESARISYHYRRVFMLDPSGVERISSPATSETIDPHLLAEITPTLAAGKVRLFDFHQHQDKTIHLSILIPIYANQNINQPLSIIVLDIDPNTYLYPLLNQWPIPSETAETLLLRRDGQTVLYLNITRFNKNSAMALRSPLTKTELPAVKAALGQTGTAIGVDYRGVPVLADMRSVPNSPWFLVSKIDIAEVFAPLRARVWETLAFIGITALAISTSLIMLWRQELLHFYRAQAEAAAALQASNEKFEKAFMLSPDAININRLQDGVYISINNGFTTLTGYTPSEVAGKASLDLNIWANPQDRQRLVEDLQKTGTVTNLEAKFRVKNGAMKDGLMSASILEINGAPHIISITHDITERIQAEKALRESEEKFRNLFNNAKIGMFRTRLDGSEMVEFNQKYLQILNYTAEELKFVPSASLWADPREREEMIKLLKTKGHATDFECNMLNKQGEIKKCVMSMHLYPETGMIEGSIQDITERKMAEEARRESEERYRAVISNAPLIAFIIDPQGVFTLSEGKALKNLGLQPGQVVGQSAFDIYRNYPAIIAAIKNSLSGQPTRNETEVEGTVFDVIYSPIFNAEGTVVKVIGVANDITIRKQAEKKILHLNVELEKRVRERTEQLQNANKEMEAFNYSVSHDLRAPLRGIDGWSQALLEDYQDQLDEQAQEYIHRVRAETQRMGHLIDDMLQLSRLTRVEMTKKQVNLSAIAQAIAERLKQHEPQRQIHFNIQTDLCAECDSHLMEAALANLLENAFKFTSKCAAAQITLGQTEVEGERAFFIRDNGAGFDMNYAQKLFGAFQRMHKESEFPGTGIGLATVQRIIHRHGGRIWAESKIGLGTTFYFTLPPFPPT